MADELEWGSSPEGAMVARNCVLRTVVGSQVHGLVREGTDDRDEMAIYIEPPESVIGLEPVEHLSYRTQPEGMPSGPGDLDLIAYGLRKYCRLALKGSPTVLLPLFAPPEQTLIITPFGEELREMAEHFICASGTEGFVGYLEAQRRDLEKARPRPREVSEKYGYDTKYAMHALRVGYQGLEATREGRITLPVPEPQRTRLMDVRMGEVPLAEIRAELDGLIEDLGQVLIGMDPPPKLVVEQWMIGAYQRYWAEHWQPLGLE